MNSLISKCKALQYLVLGMAFMANSGLSLAEENVASRRDQVLDQYFLYATALMRDPSKAAIESILASRQFNRLSSDHVLLVGNNGSFIQDKSVYFDCRFSIHAKMMSPAGEPYMSPRPIIDGRPYKIIRKSPSSNKGLSLVAQECVEYASESLLNKIDEYIASNR